MSIRVDYLNQLLTNVRNFADDDRIDNLSPSEASFRHTTLMFDAVLVRQTIQDALAFQQISAAVYDRISMQLRGLESTIEGIYRRRLEPRDHQRVEEEDRIEGEIEIQNNPLNRASPQVVQIVVDEIPEPESEEEIEETQMTDDNSIIEEQEDCEWDFGDNQRSLR